MSTGPTFFYDLELDDPAPIVGQYLVSIGKKGIGSVYLIKGVRLVNSKAVGPDLRRWSLSVQSHPELKPYTVLDGDQSGAQVWVRGEPALPIVWYPRNAK